MTEPGVSLPTPRLDLEPDSKNVFFRCMEDSSEAILISDRHGAILYVNPAWERTYGYKREEAIGRNPRILHSGHHPPEIYQEMWSRILDPKQGYWKGELVNRTKDGHLVPVFLTITPFRSPAGEILGHIGTAVDLRFRRDLEAKVLHHDRLASIGLLANGLAHEIGTPLGVIRGRAEFVQMKASDPSISRSMETIVGQIDRISKLIRSLLRISRGCAEARLENVRISAVVGEVLALLSQNLRQDSVELRVDVPEELQILGDFEKLEQILFNLVLNSIHAIRKASKQGRKGNHYLRVRAARQRGKVSIEVADSGCGIPPADMKKLFRPFFTTQDIGEGTGLGLAIVDQLTREMAGEISVQSSPGHGTLFTLVFDPGSA